VSGTDHLEVNPDGARIYLGSGQVLRTGSFIQAGLIGSGVPKLNKDGSLAYVGKEPNIIEIYDTTTFLKVDELTTSCSFSQIQQIEVLPDESGWLILGDDIVCVVSQQPLTTRSYVDVTSCPDTNDDGCPDVAALHTRNGKSVVIIKDGCDGSFIRSIQFFNTNWKPVAIACIPDMPDVVNSNLNGISELVVLAVNKGNGNVVARIKDALTKELLNTIWFYNGDWKAKGLTGVMDTNSNSVYELAVLAVKRSDGRGRICLKDALTKELLKCIPFPKPK
jgi:hypothetical protein